MYRLIVPEPVTFKEPDGRPMKKDVQIVNGRWVQTDEDMPTMSLWEFIWEFPYNDPKMGTGYKDAVALDAIEKAFAGKKPGDLVELQDEHLTKLKQVIEQPTQAYRPKILSRLRPLMAALVKAKDEDQWREHLAEQAKKKADGEVKPESQAEPVAELPAN